MVQAALDDLARLNLITEKQHPDLLAGTGDVECEGRRLKQLLFTGGIIDRGAGAVLCHGDILGQREALEDQAYQRILPGCGLEAFWTVDLTGSRFIAHDDERLSADNHHPVNGR